MKKLAIAIASALPVAAFAAGETGTNITANVQAVAEGVQGAVSDAANAAAPIIVAVVGIGLCLWIIPTIVGVCKRAFGAGKGR